jgi:hypothetical protein
MTADAPTVPVPVFRIEGPQTIADVERELKELAAARPSHLLLPVRPKKWWFGGEAALIQLLVTWGRRDPEATLVTHIPEDQDPSIQLGHLLKRPFGLVGAWMARDVADLKLTRPLKVQANRTSEPVIDLMWRGRRDPGSAGQLSLWGEEDDDRWEAPNVSAVGDRVFLACIDHHPRWRIPQFYFPTGEVRHRDDFVALAEALARGATMTKGGTPVTGDVRRPLGSILHELFKNTHEWARTDARGATLLRSVRGVLAQGHSWAQEEVLEAAAGSIALGTYLGHPRLRSPEGRWRFLELSIFDSGLGLARRWLSDKSGDEVHLDDLRLEDEYAACMECFSRWRSSTWQSHKGVGLHEVMQTLSELGAFFRVRTGRLSLYRDFVDRPYTEAAPSGSQLLADWSGQWASLLPHAPVEGVLYTMLIPITSRWS